LWKYSSLLAIRTKPKPGKIKTPAFLAIWLVDFIKQVVAHYGFSSTKHRTAMTPQEIFHDLQTKITGLLQDSPAQDIKRNIEALLKQGFAKLDLVTREEFEVHKQILIRARIKIEELEQRLAHLESLAKKP